jgi:hypothetical protein
LSQDGANLYQGIMSVLHVFGGFRSQRTALQVKLKTVSDDDIGVCAENWSGGSVSFLLQSC